MPHDLTIEDLHIQEPEREDETLEWLLWYMSNGAEHCRSRGQTVEWEGRVQTGIPPFPCALGVMIDGEFHGAIPDPTGHPENERQVERAMEWLEGQVRIWVQWLGGARTEGDR